ncbi:MAG TPA: glycosyltransferase [Sediminibacterium sp.]|nr:glycosyltransferase [Sediminibacterium sp.]
MIENRDIVIVGLQPWDTEIGSNCRDIAVAFSKKNRVLYVNYPLDRSTLWRNRKDPKIRKRVRVINGEEDGLVSIGTDFWNLHPDIMVESINWIRYETIFNFFNKMNARRYAAAIQRAMDRLGFRDIILFNDNDIIRSFYLKELLKPSISVYYYRDFILGVNYWKRHGARLEPLLLAKSDICCANSFYFRDYCKQYNPRSYFVGQGCDLSLFNDHPGLKIPDEMTAIKRPVIGYVGALQSLRLDMSILENIAVVHPDWSLVLVGPEDREFEASNLHNYPNIYFLGAKPPESLPQYVKSFDVCLNPQAINEVTIGNYPRKIDEYLAMGKPVVATRTNLMRNVFNAYSYLATTPEDYIQLIEQALREDSPEKSVERKQYAATHSWEAHVNEISRHISAFLTGSPD